MATIRNDEIVGYWRTVAESVSDKIMQTADAAVKSELEAIKSELQTIKADLGAIKSTDGIKKIEDTVLVQLTGSIALVSRNKRHRQVLSSTYNFFGDNHVASATYNSGIASTIPFKCNDLSDVIIKITNHSDSALIHAQNDVRLFLDNAAGGTELITSFTIPSIPAAGTLIYKLSEVDAAIYASGVEKKPKYCAGGIVVRLINVAAEDVSVVFVGVSA